jgi:hypothetical protein
MDSYASHIVAVTRGEDYIREASAERQARAVRRGRKRNPQAEPRSGPVRHEVPRPVTA